MNDNTTSSAAVQAANAILSGESLPPNYSVAEAIQNMLSYIYDKEGTSPSSYMKEVLELVCNHLEPEEAIL